MDQIQAASKPALMTELLKRHPKMKGKVAANQWQA